MAYRNGTYVAFHANGTDVPVDSDIKYYNLMKAWTEKTDDDFTMVNSHDKTGAVRDTSKKQTLKLALQERLRNSKNVVLIIGETTRFDTDWVPFEISCAVDIYKIPIIAAYPGYGPILEPSKFNSLWPKALADRINNNTARVIHIPFKKEPISAAINKYNMANLPEGALTYYTRETYEKWGIGCA
ncbi:MAG: TIR domain-containing protein [Nitrospirae bacterium]|nr:TIR domain-containing protein [Nitrospirota bacterium]